MEIGTHLVHGQIVPEHAVVWWVCDKRPGYVTILLLQMVVPIVMLQQQVPLFKKIVQRQLLLSLIHI